MDTPQTNVSVNVDFENIASMSRRIRCTDMVRLTPLIEQFVEFYYKAFDSDRASLASLYGPDSMLTFEASPHQGVGNIIQKLQVRHKVTPIFPERAGGTSQAQSKQQQAD